MPEDANETTTTTEATTTSTEGAAGAAGTQQGTTQQGQATTERTFSQAELERIVGERLARDRGQRGKSETTTKQSDRKVTPDDRLDRIETEGAFYRGLARLDVKLSEDQEADLLDLFRVHKPERPGEWLAERATRFGLTRKDTTQTAASSTTSATDTATKTTAAAAATTTVPNRVNPIDTGALIDVSKLTDAERLQLGPAGIRQRLEQVITAGQSRDGRPPVPAVLRPPKR
jgi:hypothetical protein